LLNTNIQALAKKNKNHIYTNIFSTDVAENMVLNDKNINNMIKLSNLVSNFSKRKKTDAKSKLFYNRFGAPTSNFKY